MHSLKNLDLSYTQFNNEEFIKIGHALTNLYELTSLNLNSYYHVSPEEAILVANSLKDKVKLEEFFIEIRSKGENLSLTLLAFAKTFENKLNLKELQFIISSSSEIDSYAKNAFVNSLATSKLEYLKLEGKIINDDNAKALGNLLSKTTDIETLSLNGNDISREGAEYILNKLGNHYRVEYIGFNGNNLNYDYDIFLTSDVVLNNLLKMKYISIGNHVDKEYVPTFTFYKEK